MSLRNALAGFLHRRGVAIKEKAPRRATLWLELGSWLSSELGAVHHDLVSVLTEREDRWGAVEIGQAAARRYEKNAEAWLLLGNTYLGAYRQDDALRAFEQALLLEERADAALAAGRVYRRLGRPVDAADRFAMAYAVGGGPEAMLENARALNDAGDYDAAEEALELWASLVPRGTEQLAEARARLKAGTL